MMMVAGSEINGKGLAIKCVLLALAISLPGSFPRSGIVSAQDTSPATKRELPASPHIVATSVRPGENSTANIVYGLTRADLDAITKTIPNLELVAPVREIYRTARFGEQTSDVQLTGTVTHYERAHRLSVGRGRFLSEKDNEQLQNIAILGAEVARNLFLDQDPIGKSVRIDNHYFLVVGVLASDRAADEAADADQRIFVPLETMRARLGDRQLQRRAGAFTLNEFQLSRIEIFVKNPSEVEKTGALVESLLHRLHEDASFQVSTSLQEPTRTKND